VAIIGLLAAIAIPNFLRARSTSQQNACINNLRQIDGATQQWALETSQPSGAAVAADGSGIKPYLGRGSTGQLPYCPVDPTKTWAASYTVTTISVQPACNIQAAGNPAGSYMHVLPAGG
jgi:type II secretory pathway pseudopilin PulG